LVGLGYDFCSPLYVGDTGENRFSLAFDIDQTKTTALVAFALSVRNAFFLTTITFIKGSNFLKGG